MLFGPWTEAKPREGEWVVELPEDDPRSLSTLLGILHGKFANVPTTLPLDGLYRIVLVADKYDLMSIIWPWASAWLCHVSSSQTATLDINLTLFRAHTGHRNPLYGVRERTAKAFVAWHLGCEDMLSKQIEHFIFNTSIPKGGNKTQLFCDMESISTDTNFGPSDFLGMETPNAGPCLGIVL
jgi:hypothetical protein